LADALKTLTVARHGRSNSSTERRLAIATAIRITQQQRSEYCYLRMGTNFTKSVVDLQKGLGVMVLSSCLSSCEGQGKKCN
jgi:hypothetical protein